MAEAEAQDISAHLSRLTAIRSLAMDLELTATRCYMTARSAAAYARIARVLAKATEDLKRADWGDCTKLACPPGYCCFRGGCIECPAERPKKPGDLERWVNVLSPGGAR
jgi:hypothetical protein